MSDYLTRSRSLPKSFLFILPLLVFYEIGILLYSSETKNTADVIVKKPFGIFGDNAALVFNFLIIIIAFYSIFYIEKKNRFSCRIFIPMFIESLAYAFSLGYVILFFVHGYLPFDIYKFICTECHKGYNYFFGSRRLRRNTLQIVAV